MAHRKQFYDREALADAVAANKSLTGALRQLGLRVGGGTFTRIARDVRAFGFDTSQWTG